MNKLKMVFDNVAWNGKDVGDNSQFWKHAVIVRRYFDSKGEELADVVFLESGRTSRGHIVAFMKDVD